MAVFSRRATVTLGIVALVVVGAVAAIFNFNSHADASALQTNASQAATPTRPRTRPAGGSSAAPASTPIAVAKATSTPQPFVFKAAGNLVSINQATLAFQAAGRIQQISVVEGNRVKAGDVIAALDTAALDAQVVQAQATYDSAVANLVKVQAGPTADDITVAKTNVDHAKAALDQAQAAYDLIGGASNPRIGMTNQAANLAQAGSAYQAALAQYDLTVKHPTDAELKAAQAAAAQAQAALQAAKQNAANARITAPFDGTVLWIGARLGETAAAGAAEVVVADLSHMQVQVNVDEMAQLSLQVGQPVTLTISALGGKTVTGHISRIGLLATTSGSIVSTPVTVDIDPTNVPIYPGLTATVQFQDLAQ